MSEFFNSGFFNNVGSNVLDCLMTEIAEWMLDAKCELLTVTKGMRYNNNIEFRSIKEIKKYLYLGEDKDVIEFIRLMRVDLPNGFSGFADRGLISQCIDEIKIIKCNIKNLNNFPRVNSDAVITIDACPTLHDISGIAEKNNRFDTLNIIQCNHITHTENLSKLCIDTLYAYDDVLDHMIITGDMIGNINKKISMAIKWYSKSNDLIDKLNKKYPSADKIILR